MDLIFTTGNFFDKIGKITKLENIRDSINKKKEEGVEISFAAKRALSVFPISDVRVLFAVDGDRIVKTIESNEASNIKKIENAGFSNVVFVNPIFDEDINIKAICYHIPQEYCEKIGWTDSKNPPAFVAEVFTKLDCMPDEIID